MELILRDFFSFAPSAGRSGGPSIDPSIREAAKSGKGLKVTLTASHAGMVNGNNVMYSPQGMKDSVHTWVWPQKAPIQIHHDDYSDPIGRVIGARYAPFGESGVPEGQRDALTTFNKLVKDSVVDGAKALEDSKVLWQQDWRGVGELVLEGIITDSDAIEKVLDGRYQGVSVTQHPGQAFCSICGQDWVKDGSCEHSRGEKDEESDRKMYLIVGDTSYVEISYVNRPADPYAFSKTSQQVDLGEGFQSQQDGSESPALFDSRVQTTVSFQLVDSLDGDQDMRKRHKKNLDKQNQNVPPTDPKDLSDTEGTPPETPPEEEPEEISVDDALKSFFEDGDNFTEEMGEILNEEMEKLVEESDAKLSTKQRKSLAPSTFCGPGKSFPVPDCSHVVAARRLIGRYKGPGSKKSILACVAKKAKVLGCNSDSQEPQDPNLQQDQICLTNLEDADLVNILLDAEKLMVERGLKAPRKCEACEEKDQLISDFELKVPDLEDRVKILRSEYKTVLGEHSASEDAHSSTLEKYQDHLRNYVLTALLLTDKETSVEKLEEKVQAMSFEDLQKEAKKVDFSETISFVRSGMSREPEGPVNQSDSNPEETRPSDPVIKMARTLVNLRSSNGKRFANECMCDWIRAGKLPEGFTLDKAAELVAE